MSEYFKQWAQNTIRPSEVAKVILQAVTSDNPDFRYVLGKDAAMMLETRRSMSDREFQDLIRQQPSPGTIYPALKSLREMGFIISSDEKESKTIVYTLTERGKSALRISKRILKGLFLEFSRKTTDIASICLVLIFNKGKSRLTL
jgi:DNA-binding MarR family transcriptional regulator